MDFTLVFGEKKDFCIDEVPFIKKLKKGNLNQKESSFLDDTDFVWSKYKCAHIIELQKMVHYEIQELKKQKSFLKKKADKNEMHNDDMQDIIR